MVKIDDLEDYPHKKLSTQTVASGYDDARSPQQSVMSLYPPNRPEILFTGFDELRHSTGCPRPSGGVLPQGKQSFMAIGMRIYATVAKIMIEVECKKHD